MQSGLEYYRGERQRRNRRILGKFRHMGNFNPGRGTEHAGKRGGGQARHCPMAGSAPVCQIHPGCFRSFSESGRTLLRQPGKGAGEGVHTIDSECRRYSGTAYPVRYRFLNHPELEKMIRRFTEDGLQGVETYYTENRPADTRYLEALSEKYRLIRTGGSDYHGKRSRTTIWVMAMETWGRPWIGFRLQLHHPLLQHRMHLVRSQLLHGFDDKERLCMSTWGMHRLSSDITRSS